jgi:hypothetical protein
MPARYRAAIRFRVLQGAPVSKLLLPQQGDAEQTHS